MPEHFVRLYRKEEEFLEDFSECAFAAAKLLSADWTPNFQASDGTRRNEAYFLRSGELSALTFDCAAVYHENQRFSSVQIALVSSTREVTIRVDNGDAEMNATKTVDRARNS